MEKSGFANDLEQVLMAPFYLDIAIGLFYFFAFTAVFIGIVVLFFNSNRPGRLMMLFGVVLAALTALPLLFLNEGVEMNVSNMNSFYLWYLPMADSLFTLLGCFGFLTFSLSFRNKNNSLKK